MTENEIRIAVAEACDWGGIGYLTRTYNLNNGPYGYSEFTINCLPDYPNDLNAMHEAEKTLTGDQLAVYNEHLIQMVINQLKRPYEMQGWYWHATARQRAEAFLRTTGKRKEFTSELQTN